MSDHSDSDDVKNDDTEYYDASSAYSTYQCLDKIMSIIDEHNNELKPTDYVGTSLSQDARLGIVNFAADAFFELSFSDSTTMTTNELRLYLGNNGIGTATYDAITITTDLFDSESKEESTKALIFITDGKPCCSNLGQSIDVCSLASSLTTRDIFVYIIGVGSFEISKMDCLVADPDTDMVTIDDFDTDEFDTLLDPLSDITCPGRII